MGYVDVINALATTTEAYQQETAELVRESLRESVLKLNLATDRSRVRVPTSMLDMGSSPCSLVRGPTIWHPDPRFQEVIRTSSSKQGSIWTRLWPPIGTRSTRPFMLNAELGYRLRFGQDWTARFALGPPSPSPG